MIDPRRFGLLWPSLLVALGLLLVAVVPLDARPTSLQYVTIGYVLGTLFGNTTLAAAWTALGPLPLVLRLPLSIAWLASLLFVFAINVAVYQGPGLGAELMPCAKL